MPFDRGRVTFCRFRVVGDGPTTVDEALLEILHDNRFQETSVGAPDELESGWITGEHLFDTQFDYEKNGFGNRLLAAIRIDTHKPPSEVKQAYRKINESMAASENPSGYASKRQKREAVEQASRQIHEDLAAGKYRRSKMIPILWDLGTQTLYCGAATGQVQEELARLMLGSFELKLEPLTSGIAAREVLEQTGEQHRYENLKPSPFTVPPPSASADMEDAAGPDDVETPYVPWVAASADGKDFAGNEFAIYLWWMAEAGNGAVPMTGPTGEKTEAFFAIDKSLDMDCAWGATGKLSLRGDGPTQLREARDALAIGKWPRKLGVILADAEHQWQFTLQADRMIVSSAALPEITEVTSPRELLESRLELSVGLSDTLSAMYAEFVRRRAADGWPNIRRKITDWLRT